MAYNSASDLEKLVADCEFENQQYVKLIEHEDQLIENLKKEIELKEEENVRLQEAVTQIDEDTEQCHKQTTLNRENLESLKKTNHVLTEHVAAMDSKMEMLQHKIQAERQEHNCHLQRYKDIWATYQAKYESLPLALELKRQTVMVEDLVKSNTDNEADIQEAKNKIEQLQGQGDVYKMGINSFIISLAKMKQATFEIKEEIERKRSELNEIKHSAQYIEQSDSDRTNENNLQKLTDMHLVDKESTEKGVESMESSDQHMQQETQSPMISMLGDRDDELEAMKTDVVSHLQIVEENKMVQHADTSDPQEQVTSFYNSTNTQPVLHENQLQTTNHTEIENREGEHKLPVDSQTTSSANFPVPNNQSISQGAQLPFVAYQTRGPETVHIHLDEQKHQQQQQQQQQPPRVQDHSPYKQPSSRTSNQPTLGQNVMPCQRPANLTSDGASSSSPFPCYRPHIPQVVKPTSRYRPSVPSPRPSVNQQRPSFKTIPVLQSRPSTPQVFVPQGKMVQGSPSVRPQPSPVPRSYHSAPSPRLTFGHSKLPVLQPVRTTSVPQLKRPQQLSVPNRQPGTSDNHNQRMVQTSIPSAVRSPLQLPSPPIRLQSPQVVQRSPLQLPTQHQHFQQQKTIPQTSFQSHSSTSSKVQSVQETSVEVHQSQNNAVLSPEEINADKNLKESISPHESEQNQEATVVASEPSGPDMPQIGVKIPQPDGTSTYFMRIKDTSEDSAENSSLSKSPGKPATPERTDDGSLKEETFSPFDMEKHRKKLADMKKSPAHPNFYPVKRAFAEMEGNCQDVGNENMQFPLFGQANSTLTTPFDGSGDHTNAGNMKGQNDGQSTKPVTDTEVQSAFSFFGAFRGSKDASDCKSPGYTFNFGSGDSSKTTGSPGFSLFGASNIDNDIPCGFNFGFGDQSGAKQGSQPDSSGDGNFLSMFGNGGNDDQTSSTGFTFNFGGERSKTPPFSFF